MKHKVAFRAVLVLGSVLAAVGFQAAAGDKSPHDTTGFTAMVAGYQVRLVAVGEFPLAQGQRHADHSWTPDGLPFDGPEARLGQAGAMAPSIGATREIHFEIQPHSEKEPADAGGGIDAFAYLPSGHVPDGDTPNPVAVGPATAQIWQGGPTQDSAGQPTLAGPCSMAMDVVPSDTRTQPVAFGLAKGEYRTVVKGAASVPNLKETESSVLASGPWGRLEVTHLKMPMFQSRPSPTHLFRLLGGPYPPVAERKVVFYNSKGAVIARCGDGPNNGGPAGYWAGNANGPADISSFEIQERPYDFVQFNHVSFSAPIVDVYSGAEGLKHTIDTPLGKILGVIKPTKDGAWQGYVLYAGDGKRWIDPSKEAAGYGYGMFDPWDHPLDKRWNIMIEPNERLLAPNSTLCDLYAADSPNGEPHERLTSWNELPFRAGMDTIPCAPTDRPYVRIELRTGGADKWRTIESIPVAARLHDAQTASLGSRVFEIFIDEDGSIRIWKDEPLPVVSKHRWKPGQDRVRFLAHMRGGGTAELSNNVAGYSGVAPHETNRFHGIECTRQVEGAKVQSVSGWIDAIDIVSVDLQIENLDPPVTIFVHSPKLK